MKLSEFRYNSRKEELDVTLKDYGIRICIYPCQTIMKCKKETKNNFCKNYITMRIVPEDCENKGSYFIIELISSNNPLYKTLYNELYWLFRFAYFEAKEGVLTIQAVDDYVETEVNNLLSPEELGWVVDNIRDIIIEYYGE